MNVEQVPRLPTFAARWVLEDELGDEDDRARGVDEGGARGATVRHALAVPQEFKDEATGEMLDVIQDNDPDLPREPDRREPRSLDRCPARQ